MSNEEGGICIIFSVSNIGFSPVINNKTGRSSVWKYRSPKNELMKEMGVGKYSKSKQKSLKIDENQSLGDYTSRQSISPHQAKVNESIKYYSKEYKRLLPFEKKHIDNMVEKRFKDGYYI